MKWKKHSYHSVSSHLWWVPAVPEATIQSWQFVHVCITEWKVKQLRVPLYPVTVGWFGEHRDTLLHSPAQQYLIKTHISIWGEPKNVFYRDVFCRLSLPVQVCDHNSLPPPKLLGGRAALLSLRRNTLENKPRTPCTHSSALSGTAVGETPPGKRSHWRFQNATLFSYFVPI